MRVVVIFAPPPARRRLLERIADGQRSVLFAHHADYAAATTAEHPSDALWAFRRRAALPARRPLDAWPGPRRSTKPATSIARAMSRRG